MDNREFIEMVRESKSNNDVLMQIINNFEPKIKKELSNTDFSHREDLSQDIKYKLVTCIRQYNEENIPGFWDMQLRFKTN